MRHSRRLAATVVVFFSLCPSATAQEAAEREVAELAERAAAGDPVALRRLRTIERVAGRPADLERALDGDVRHRATTLARWDPALDDPSGPVPSGDSARRRAEQVLAQPEYHASRTPRPLRGLLRRIGEALDPALGPVARAAERLWSDPAARLLTGLSAVAVVAIAATALVRRRARAVEAARTRARRRAAPETPEDLEQAADSAERGGEPALAYRLRFRAGVLRLAAEGAFAYRPALTTGDLRRQLRSPAFDVLAARFDEVAYGGDAATPRDLDAVRTGWPRVRQEVGAR